MKFDASKLKNGTVLLIGVSYNGARQPGGDQRGMARPLVYTYGLLKAGGKWYMTGMGDVPQAAGWGAVERWLGKQDRRLEWVKGTTDEAMADLWTADVTEPGYPCEGAEMGVCGGGPVHDEACPSSEQNPDYGADPTCNDMTHDHSTSSCRGPRAQNPAYGAES